MEINIQEIDIEETQKLIQSAFGSQKVFANLLGLKESNFSKRLKKPKPKFILTLKEHKMFVAKQTTYPEKNSSELRVKESVNEVDQVVLSEGNKDKIIVNLLERIDQLEKELANLRKYKND